MALTDRKTSLATRTGIVLAALLAHAVAWGAGDAKGMKETAPARTAAAVPHAGSGVDAEIAAARSALKANPGNVPAHVRLGYLLVSKGSLDEAMGVFDEALKINPRACDAKTGRGAVLARKGNLKEAEQTLKDALLLNPNPVRTHYELGLVYEKLGAPERAVAEFKEGIKKHEQGRE